MHCVFFDSWLFGLRALVLECKSAPGVLPMH